MSGKDTEILFFNFFDFFLFFMFFFLFFFSFFGFLNLFLKIMKEKINFKKFKVEFEFFSFW
jgi:hypothetical protein